MGCGYAVGCARVADYLPALQEKKAPPFHRLCSISYVV